AGKGPRHGPHAPASQHPDRGEGLAKELPAAQQVLGRPALRCVAGSHRATPGQVVGQVVRQAPR
ncbi:MAG: hypothetical protein ACKO3P_20895, partial [Planctomycetaceae bacterium]